MLAGPDLGRLTKLAVISRYHFCLAFENSIAPDYVTEKIFQPLLAGTIPIYRGAPNFQQFVPEGSFINADAYNGPNDLADYLHHLLESPKEYEAYFAWRRKPLPTFLLEAISSLNSHHLLRLQSVVEQRIGNRQRRHFGFPSYPFGLSAVVKARTRKWRCASVPAPTNLMQPAMAADADDHVMYGYGWCWSEPTGRWTNGPLAWLWIQRPPGREGSLLRVAGHMIARPDEPQVVDIWSGWRRLGRLSWPAGVRSVATIRLPSALHRRDVLTLIFRIQKPIAPADIGIGEDSRQLGLFLEGIRSSPCMRDAAATPIHLHIHKGSGDLGILWSGWSAPEPTGCWTDGPDAVLQWTSPRELPADARRIIQGVGFAPGGQPPRGSVFINGRRAGDLDRLHWKCGAADLSMPIGAPLMRREITVHIQLDNPRSPRELGISSDERKLGLFVQSLHIEIDHHTESSHSKKLPAGSA